jgi:tRNA(fMet)-specific endonuclease VapC
LEASSVTQAAAVEAATIEAELLDRGRQINALDVLFAGVVREAGRTIVTRDSDFERVEGLQVESY